MSASIPRPSPLPLLAALAVAAACAQPDDGDLPGAAEPVFPESSPTVAGCSAGSPQPVAFPGAYSVGDFTVAIDAGARLGIDHVDGGGELASPLAGRPFEVSRGRLHVEEHQGSFEVDADVDATCRMPRVDALFRGAGTLTAQGSFDDCEQLRWTLGFCEPSEGQLWFSLTTSDPAFDQIELRVASDADERIVGMGEQFPHDGIDLNGELIPVLSQEGGIGRGHVPITPAVNLASPGSGGSEKTSYYAAPHYITSRLRSVMLENTEYATFDFRKGDATAIRVYAPEMTGRVLQGTSPLELVERFTDWAGRMPPPPDWVSRGAILALARDLGESRQIVDDLEARGAAIAGVWNQTWSGKVETFIGEQVLWNWIQSETFHPGWDAFVTDMDARGIRTLCYVNPMLVDPPADAGPVRRNLFEEARDRGYLVRDQAGDDYLLEVTAFEVGLLDLANPGARAWMKQVIRDEMLGGAGCSGWMADFAEALPFDAVLHSGASAAAYHNQYPVDWVRLSREAVEEAGRLGDVLVFNRAGSARTPRHSMLVWEGDQLTTWDRYDGMVSALRGLLGGGFSGIALNHSDTGGYTSLSFAGLVGYEREAELLARWTEMNAFTAVLRTHEGNQPGVNAQVYSSGDTMDHFARFTRVYRALAFYREQLFDEAATRGWPVVRHLWMHYPDDPTALTTDDQFLLGSEILVAPIKNKCWTWPWCPYNKRVYLPAGEWVHLWSGRRYGDTGRGVSITVEAPIGEPAVFYRAGSPVGATFVDNLRAEGITAY